MAQSWSIIIFGYNEAESLRGVIDSVERVLNELNPNENEVIIVDDGSSDDSLSVIRAAKEDYNNITPVLHETNLGIGEALRSGYSNAKCENVCAVPADGQFDLKELLEFAEVPEKTIVSFCRTKKQGYTAARHALSLINRFINRIFLGLKIQDVNWVKIYKRAGLNAINIELKSSLLETELCAKLLLHEYNIKEAPSSYLERSAGVARGASGKIVIKALRETLLLLLVYWRYRLKGGIGQTS